MFGGIKDTFAGFSSPAGSGGKGLRSRRAILFVVLLVLVVLVLVLLAVSRRGGVLPEPLALPLRRGAAPKISETYKNPFDRETQYVNPFGEFKSTFQSLQQ